MRQQVVRRVNAETVYDAGDEEEEEFVEGRDDVLLCRAAPCQRTINGVCQQNVHLDFSAEGNDPSSQCATLSQAYSLIEFLSHAVAQAMAGPQQPRGHMWLSG